MKKEKPLHPESYKAAMKEVRKIVTVSHRHTPMPMAKQKKA